MKLANEPKIYQEAVGNNNYSACEVSYFSHDRDSINHLITDVLTPKIGDTLYLEENIFNYYRYSTDLKRENAPEFISILREMGSNNIHVKAFFKQYAQAEQFSKNLVE